MQNGRVSFVERAPAQPGYTGALPGFGYRTDAGDTDAMDAIRGSLLPNMLNQTFMSPANIQIVQNKIRREVYDRSGGEFLISQQSADELTTVMRAMYLQYGKNRDTGIREQIEELNQIVADWCVPKIIAECSMHKTYLHDIQHLPVPLERPVLMTMAGTKSATFDRFF